MYVKIRLYVSNKIGFNCLNFTISVSLQYHIALRYAMDIFCGVPSMSIISIVKVRNGSWKAPTISQEGVRYKAVSDEMVTDG
jgi:hypothetical protein